MGLSFGDADNIGSSALISVTTGFGDSPNTLIRFAIAGVKLFVQDQYLAVPYPGNIRHELTSQISETIFE